MREETMNKDEAIICHNNLVELCEEEHYEIFAGDSKGFISSINIKEFIDFIKSLIP